MKANLLQILCLSMLSLAMVACAGDDSLDDVAVAEESKGTLTLYSTDYTADWDEGTRSLEPLSDILQKQIHNLYYFFYDAEGYIEKIYYQNVNPTMEVRVDFNSFKDEDGKTVITPHGIVYIIANSQKMATGDNNEEPVLVSSENVNVGNADEWKRTVPTVNDFREQATFPIFLGNVGMGNVGVQGGNPYVGRPDHIIMFGFFDGTMMEGRNLQVPLGRLAARLRVSLSGPGLGKQARITIENAPRYTHLFPDESKEMSDFFGTFEETIDIGSQTDNYEVFDANGVFQYYNWGDDLMYGGIDVNGAEYSASVFYYCGENEYEHSRKITTLKIETWDDVKKWDEMPEQTDPRKHRTRDPENDKPDRTYFVELGHNSPDVTKPPYNEERKYCLHRNTSYTFNITLNE